MSDGTDTSKEIQDMVRLLGDEVAIHEPPCVLWKSEHENCTGCKYELGCCKTVKIMAIMLIPAMYTPTSFADHQAMQDHILKLMDLIIEAKTVEELKLVPHI